MMFRLQKPSPLYEYWSECVTRSCRCYIRRGAVTAPLINKSTFSPPPNHDGGKPSHRPRPNSIAEWQCAGFLKKGRRYSFDWYEHDGSTWMYGELMEELREKGRWGTYPRQVVFTKVVSSPWSVLVYSEGLRGRETGFIPHLLHTPARSDGSRPGKHTQRLVMLLSLAAWQDPPQTLARTGSRRAPLTVSLLSVCLLGGGGPMGRHTGTSGFSQGKARWI